MLAIPLTNDVDQTVAVRSGAARISVRVHWQPLTKQWYLSAFSAVGTYTVNRQIPSPRALGEDRFDTEYLVNNAAFPGELAVIPLADYSGEIGRRPWGNTHQLVWLTRADLERIG